MKNRQLLRRLHATTGFVCEHQTAQPRSLPPPLLSDIVARPIQHLIFFVFFFVSSILLNFPLSYSPNYIQVHYCIYSPLGRKRLHLNGVGSLLVAILSVPKETSTASLTQLNRKTFYLLLPSTPSSHVFLKSSSFTRDKASLDPSKGLPCDSFSLCTYSRHRSFQLG